MAKRRKPLVGHAMRALEELKWEVAKEIGIYDKIQDVGFRNITTSEAGALGGRITQIAVRDFQNRLAQDYAQKNNEPFNPSFEEDDYEYESEHKIQPYSGQILQ